MNSKKYKVLYMPRLRPGLVNFIPALAYLNLPEAFMQPGRRLLADRDPCSLIRAERSMAEVSV